MVSIVIVIFLLVARFQRQREQSGREGKGSDRHSARATSISTRLERSLRESSRSARSASSARTVPSICGEAPSAHWRSASSRRQEVQPWPAGRYARETHWPLEPPHTT